MASLIVHLGAAQMDQAVWRLYACILLTRNSFLKIKAVNLAAAIIVSVTGTENPTFSSTEQHIFIQIFKDEPLNVCACVCAFKIPQREMHVFGKVGHK